MKMKRFDNRGMTLLELLIAVTLLAVVAAALYGTFFAIVKGRDRATADMEQRREVGQTIDRLRRELSSVLYRRPPGTPPEGADGFFKVEDRDAFGKPASTLFFTAFTVPPSEEGVPRSDQMKVRYKVMEKDDRLILVRDEADILQDREPTPYPQMEEIDGFLVECYDGAKWVKTWNTLNNGSVPKRVRVTIRTKESGKPVEFTATVPLRLSP